MAALIVLAVLVVLVVLSRREVGGVGAAGRGGRDRAAGPLRRTVSGQLTFLVPFVDRIRAKVDLRERVVSFAPQPVITQDNLTLSIDTVVYFQVTNPQAAVYEISNYIAAVEQLTITTLRNVVGGMTLEETLTSRDSINGQLRGVLTRPPDAGGCVSPASSSKHRPAARRSKSMEKQMKADREKRAMILTAEGHRESCDQDRRGCQAEPDPGGRGCQAGVDSSGPRVSGSRGS
ncbi:SPFH/Band 7/PHB domain protein, partial [Rhodococcus hoagii]|nr:SPFH/Band 7/PHB domain protein [Prescottella equi]